MTVRCSITVNEMRKALGMKRKTGEVKNIHGWTYDGHLIDRFLFRRYNVVEYLSAKPVNPMGSTLLAVFDDIAYLDD